MPIAHIGLGSNLNNPKQQLEQALSALAELEQSTLCVQSPLYISKALGPEQPDYLNAAAKLDTALTPLELLAALQGVEHSHKRERTMHWGPRTLDLDILTYGDQTIDHPRLQVPHPHMTLRSFVILPLYDISPDLVLPNGVSIASLWAQSIGLKPP